MRRCVLLALNSKFCQRYHWNICNFLCPPHEHRLWNWVAVQKRFQWTSTYHNKLNNVKKLPSILSRNLFLFADGGDLHDTSLCLPQVSSCCAETEDTHTHYSSFGELVCHYQVIAEWTYQKHLTLCIEIPVRFQMQSYDVLTCADRSTDSCLNLSRLTIAMQTLFDCLRLCVTRERVY